LVPIVRIPIPFPDFIHRPLKKTAMDFASRTPESNAALPRGPNREGDRDIEWTRISANMPSDPGRALDFGIG
jgi:hypothetical protein